MRPIVMPHCGPIVQAETFQIFQLSWDFKIGPSAANSSATHLFSRNQTVLCQRIYWIIFFSFLVCIVLVCLYNDFQWLLRDLNNFDLPNISNLKMKCLPLMHNCTVLYFNNLGKPSKKQTGNSLVFGSTQVGSAYIMVWTTHPTHPTRSNPWNSLLLLFLYRKLQAEHSGHH